MNSSARFLLILILIIVGAILLYFLTGITYVRKNTVAFLSKHGAYKKTLGPGWHYFIPHSIHLSRRYKENENRNLHINTDNGRLLIKGIIYDAKSFEFAKPGAKEIVLRISSQSGVGLIPEEGIRNGLETIGFRVTSIRKE